MNSDEQLKNIVKEKYAELALSDKSARNSSCCDTSCCAEESTNLMADDYRELNGYNPAADLGLGCGLPTEFAKIKKCDIVIDLGSGAGNDVFIARHETGDGGKVIGIDFTPAMIDKARQNAALLGFENVEFRLGDIEHMPVESNSADVIVSNCVLNLVPDKDAVMKEIFRVLKPGAHFSISDIVLETELPADLKNAAELYAGCVAGAIQKNAYLEIITANGFVNISVQKIKPILLPESIIEKLGPHKRSVSGESIISSITVYAEKAATEIQSCCGPQCCN